MIRKDPWDLVWLVLLASLVLPQSASAGDLLGIKGMDVGGVLPGGECWLAKGGQGPSGAVWLDAARYSFNILKKYGLKDRKNWKLERIVICTGSDIRRTMRDGSSEKIGKALDYKPFHDIVYGPADCSLGLNHVEETIEYEHLYSYEDYETPKRIGSENIFFFTTFYKVKFKFGLTTWDCPKRESIPQPKVTTDLDGDGIEDDHFADWDPSAKDFLIPLEDTTPKMKVEKSNVLIGLRNGRNGIPWRPTDEDGYILYDSIYIADIGLIADSYIEGFPLGVIPGIGDMELKPIKPEEVLGIIIRGAMTVPFPEKGGVLEVRGRKYAVLDKDLDAQRVKLGEVQDILELPVYGELIPGQGLSVQLDPILGLGNVEMQCVKREDARALHFYQDDEYKGFLVIPLEETQPLDLTDDLMEILPNVASNYRLLFKEPATAMFVDVASISWINDGDSAFGYDKVKVFDPDFASDNLGVDSKNVMVFLGPEIPVKRGGNTTLHGVHLPPGKYDYDYEEFRLYYDLDGNLELKRLQYPVFPFSAAMWKINEPALLELVVEKGEIVTTTDNNTIWITYPPSCTENCTKIVFIQVVCRKVILEDESEQYYKPGDANQNWRDKANDTVNGGNKLCTVDYITGESDPFYNGDDNVDIGSQGKHESSRNATMTDAPRYADNRFDKLERKFGKTVKKLVSEFETCAYCAEGADKGKFYGCVKWTYEKERGERGISMADGKTSGPSKKFKDALKKWNDNHGFGG